MTKGDRDPGNAPSSPTIPGLDKVQEIKARADKPDSKTQSELYDLDHQLKKEELQGLIQDRKERKTYANRIFWLIVGWLAMLFVVVLLQGFGLVAFDLDGKVLIALITGTTVNVIGIFLVVANYLFPRHPTSK